MPNIVTGVTTKFAHLMPSWVVRISVQNIVMLLALHVIRDTRITYALAVYLDKCEKGHHEKFVCVFSSIPGLLRCFKSELWLRRSKRFRLIAARVIAGRRHYKKIIEAGRSGGVMWFSKIIISARTFHAFPKQGVHPLNFPFVSSEHVWIKSFMGRVWESCMDQNCVPVNEITFFLLLTLRQQSYTWASWA